MPKKKITKEVRFWALMTDGKICEYFNTNYSVLMPAIFKSKEAARSVWRQDKYADAELVPLDVVVSVKTEKALAALNS